VNGGIYDDSPPASLVNPKGLFHVADLSAQGELRQIAEYDYESLELIPGASDLIGRCSGALYKNADEFEIELNDERTTWVRWRSTAAGTGVATVRHGENELVSLSILATGADPQSESATLDVLQKHIARQLLQTPFEPAFDLMQIQPRPLLATVTLATGGDACDHRIWALADRAFAAAYFRYFRLV
jgi:hypothetical protein